MSLLATFRRVMSPIDWLKHAGREVLAPLTSSDNGLDTGRVYIVGAGPGDAELLTIKAFKAIQAADIVLFDWLVDESVLSLIPKGVKTEFVGKRSGRHSVPQAAICDRMVELALQGKVVVRLKGGDPAIFARTLEETQALSAHQIPFAIIPGITTASGMSAYTGIPLTQRGVARSVRFATGHLQHKDDHIDWHNEAKYLDHETLVVYMGVKKLPDICQQLSEAGVKASLPVALVENACCRHQRVITGDLGCITDLVRHANISGPALLIFGEVVESRQGVNLSLLQQVGHVSAI